MQGKNVASESSAEFLCVILLSAIQTMLAKFILLSALVQGTMSMGTEANLKTSVMETIRSYVDTYAPTKSQCTDTECCTVSSSESCSLSNMPKDETTLVLPGGDTRCIYSYSTPFAFQVIPGASDKLIFYFQGGGACWDETSTKLGFCSSDASPQSLVGIFDRNNKDNRFKDYTIVQALYCSGDVYGGNVTRPYNDKDGVPVQQKGLANAQSVLDWVVRQQSTGALASTLSELVVMGCSAGSIGAQLWGKQVLTTLKWEKAAVVPDSYAGIFPEGTTGPLVYDYGFCSSGFLSPELYAKCMDQTITMQDIDLEFIAATPSVPYTFIQSKVDDVQMSFYIAIGLTSHIEDPLINPTEFYDDVNSVFGLYNANLANFVTYLVDGPHHCFTNQDLYYNADAMGPHDDGKTNSGLMLSDWTNIVPLSEGEAQNTVCEGAVQVGAVQQPKGKVATQGDNDYCSSGVVPKQYIQ